MKYFATVVENGKRELFVKISSADDQGENPPIPVKIPCDTAEQAWAVCDAYNYPESNINDWRAALLKNDAA